MRTPFEILGLPESATDQDHLLKLKSLLLKRNLILMRGLGD